MTESPERRLLRKCKRALREVVPTPRPRLLIEIDALLAQPEGQNNAAGQGQVNAGERRSAGVPHIEGCSLAPTTGETQQAGCNPAPAAPSEKHSEALKIATALLAEIKRCEAAQYYNPNRTLKPLAEWVVNQAVYPRIDQLEQELAGAEGRIREIEADYERISDLLASAQSTTPAIDVVDAARELLSEHNYVTGMRGDDQNKGSGNRLADAMLAYDAVLAAADKTASDKGQG